MQVTLRPGNGLEATVSWEYQGPAGIVGTNFWIIDAYQETERAFASKVANVGDTPTWAPIVAKPYIPGNWTSPIPVGSYRARVTAYWRPNTSSAWTFLGTTIYPVGTIVFV